MKLYFDDNDYDLSLKLLARTNKKMSVEAFEILQNMPKELLEQINQKILSNQNPQEPCKAYIKDYEYVVFVENYLHIARYKIQTYQTEVLFVYPAKEKIKNATEEKSHIATLMKNWTDKSEFSDFYLKKLGDKYIFGVDYSKQNKNTKSIFKTSRPYKVENGEEFNQ